MYLTKFDLLISHYRGKAGIATKNIPAQNARYLHHNYLVPIEEGE